MLKHLSSIEQMKKRALELADAGREQAKPSNPIPVNDLAQRRVESERENAAKYLPSPFPSSPDGKIGAPNDLIRSSFFGAVERGARTRVQDYQVVGPSNITILLDGWRLDQIDAEIFFWLHDRASGTQPGGTLRFKLWDLLRHLGYKKPSGTEYERIKQRLEQMAMTTIRYRTQRYRGGVGGLIRFYRIDEETLEAVVATNEYMRYFFDNVTHISTAEAAELRGSPLALWLYRVIASHVEWMPILVKTVMERSGSQTASVRDFKKCLVRALDRLVEKNLIYGYGFEASARGELLLIQRSLKPTQKRHLDRKQIK